MSRAMAEDASANVPWHTLDDIEVLAETQSCLQGLTAREAEVRLARYGPNRLPCKPPPSLGLIFFHQFLSPLIYILIVAEASSAMALLIATT